MKKFWNFKSLDSKTGELYLYSEISSETWWGDETTPNTFKSDLDALGDVEVINVYQNSPGGDVFAGIAIANMLKRHKAQINMYVDGISASISSVITMSGDNIYMYKGSMLMIHNPWSLCIGNAEDMRKMAKDLDNIRDSLSECYMVNATDELTDELLIELLDKETWLNGAEASKYFNNIVVLEDEKRYVASVKDAKLLSQFKNMPVSITKMIADVNEPLDEQVIVDNSEELEIKDENADDEIIEGSEDIDAEIVNETDEVLEDSEEIKDESLDDEVKSENEADDLNDTNEDDSTNEVDETEVENLKTEITDLKNQLEILNAENERLVDIESKYNLINQESELNETKNSFKVKFEKLKAIEVFESEEVQTMISNSVSDKTMVNKLNELIIDLVLENKTNDTNNDIKDLNVKRIGNLIPAKSGISKYIEY